MSAPRTSSRALWIIGIIIEITVIVSTIVLYTAITSRPYIHSQLLRYPTTTILGNSRVEDWILNWTLDRDIRVLRIQIWMGNPSGVEWEGDVFVTLGKPNDPWNPDTDQLLAHLQFDSHAPPPLPHLFVFELHPGFKVASGQTINVYRLFVNTESYQVDSGDVEVIIYYEQE